MNVLEIKHKLHVFCQEYLAKRIQTCEQALALLHQDIEEETKSSAGDKYETGRSMIQLEMEKHNNQLAESIKLKNQLDRIKPALHNSNVIQPGSLVITDQGNYYLSISAGQVVIDNKNYLCISPSSPIGLSLSQAAKGQAVQFNTRSFKILDVQ
ncbi:3-oxoacyl-ACP synthase [Chryseosolibacter indicus]|uniref:3-oxoacyl-ACP synthase n=1 Tax=Chryseosolibacter indicus TaxID=2782351 RepID=A0ABS5VMM2_9BACT|nr:3-oxoacyl-ACP synthase [Chryseosolibacter indicus]MBT1702702.1 3-oxoacyl-ACP synthase [Chryseosolibacter indicus]